MICRYSSNDSMKFGIGRKPRRSSPIHRGVVQRFILQMIGQCSTPLERLALEKNRRIHFDTVLFERQNEQCLPRASWGEAQKDHRHV